MRFNFRLLSTLLLLSAPAVFADSISVYGTGMGPGGATADGSVDANYTLSSADANNPGPNAFVTNQGTLPGPWAADSASSKWISPTANGSDNFPSVEYDYTTTFDLTGFYANTAILNGTISVDDGTAILLNGVVIDQLFGTYSQITPFQINSGFVSGLNTLTFAVQNYGGGPTGLDVSLAGSATLTPEPASAALMGAGLIAAAGLLMRRTKLAKKNQ